MVLGLSGLATLHTIGRKTDHLLANFKDSSVFNVTTSATGQALVIINPNAGFSEKASVYDATYFKGSLPYYYCSPVSNTTPFAAVETTLNFDGPYV